MVDKKDFQERLLNLVHRNGLLSSDKIKQYPDIQHGELAKLGAEAVHGIGESFSRSGQSTNEVVRHMSMLDDIERRANKIIGQSSISTSSSYSGSSSLRTSSSYSTPSSSEENILVSILLFPFRLPIWIVKTVFQIIGAILAFFLFLGFAGFATVVGVPFAIFLLGICLFVFIPIRIFLWIITFGRVTFLEYALFDWPEGVWDWVKDSWER